MRLSAAWLLAFAGIGSLAACASSTSTPRANVDGGDAQMSAADAAPEAALPDAGADAAPDAAPVVRCGDAECTAGVEDCMTCPLDCNVCPVCDMAPTCTGALAVPTASTALASCNNIAGDDERSNYSCGTDLGVAPSETTCADPKLRIRLREISITRGWFDVPRHMYCVISAEDGMHSELLVTPISEVAGNKNETHINIRPSDGVLWGQGDLYRSISNITISYSCYLTSNTERAQGVLDDISGRAADVAEHADGYGWVFGAVSVVGTVIGSAIGTIDDTKILDVQQTISAGGLLNMTNGRNWEIRHRRGNLNLSSASDLALTIESWGCADVRTTVM